MLDLKVDHRTVSKHFNLPIKRNEEFKEIAKEMGTTEEHLLKCAILNLIKDYKRDKANALKDCDSAFQKPHANSSTDGIIPHI